MKFKPVLIYVDPDLWPQFQEYCGSRKVSERVRQLVEQDLDGYIKEEIKAQSLAGLTEA